MVKKLIALFLTLALFNFHAPLVLATIDAEQQTLQEFLATTEEIEASFTYPNFIASTKTNGKSTLHAHTPIAIKCINTITTKDIVNGDSVEFAVVTDIRDSNNNILIKAGSPVTANINFEKSGFLGKSGKLTVTDFHASAIDGTYIPLSSSITAEPEDKMVLSLVLSIFICPLFLLLKGDEAKMLAGTTKTVYTVTDCHINTSKL